MLNPPVKSRSLRVLIHTQLSLKLELLALRRWFATTLSLGGGLRASVVLAWHVLRTEGPAGVVWRLRNARDIAIGRVDPWRHFFLDGNQNRPFDITRFEHLWAGVDNSILTDLHALLEQRDQLLLDTAAWTLGRWYAKEGEWQKVHVVLADAVAAYENQLGTLPLGISLLWIDALRHQGQTKAARAFLERVQACDRRPQWTADLALARANLLHPHGGLNATDHRASGTQAWLMAINDGPDREKLAPIMLTDQLSSAVFDRLSAQRCAPLTEELTVSIIIPAYNAAASLPLALQSLQAQSWRALEIIVVDDCSEDGTASIVNTAAQHDPRIRLLRLPANSGAYAARNAGAAAALGDFITVHDSDDWSHPQKIEKQVRALLAHPHKQLSFSHWARATEDLFFGGWNTPANWHAWVHRNTSSLMIRRSAFKRLGYWDEVRCSADAEYYYRAIRVFGAQALVEVLPGIPLAFGRITARSLTQQADTSLFTLFGGLRKEYHAAFEQWHQQHNPGDPGSLYMARHPANRPFPVPCEMLVRPPIQAHAVHAAKAAPEKSGK